MSDYILELNGITKVFPGVRALDQVYFKLRPGEIHALMGENGAGKSTFIKVITGVHQADEGEMLLYGKPVSFKDPNDAKRAGIAAIYQHVTCYPDLSVTENIFMGHEQVQRGTKRILWRKMHEEAARLLRQLGAEFSPKALMGSLSVAEQQMVEIAKALSVDAKIIIMDEPTAALSKRESEELYRITEQLREQGKAIIFISHRFEDMYRLADRVTVFRDAKYIGTWDVKDISHGDLIVAMVGREITQLFPKRQHAANMELAQTGEHDDLSRKAQGRDDSSHKTPGMDETTRKGQGTDHSSQEGQGADESQLSDPMRQNRNMTQQGNRKDPPRLGEELLRVEGLGRTGYFADVSFSIHRGEIVGLTGLVGSGRTEVCQTLFGIERWDKGRVYYKGKPVRLDHPLTAMKLGIGYLPEDRQKQGLVLDWTISDNIALPSLDRLAPGGVLRKANETSLAQRLAEKLGVKAKSIFDLASSLSGGNQQKVVFAKLLAMELDVLILDEPTKGVDVGAKSAIYEIIADLASQGYGILLVSSEMPEIIGMCDRVVVMREGRVAATLERDQLTQEAILAAAMSEVRE